MLQLIQNFYFISLFHCCSWLGRFYGDIFVFLLHFWLWVDDYRFVSNHVYQLSDLIILLLRFRVDCFILLLDEFFHLVVPIQSAYVEVQRIE
jgi:hypothetical protein